MFAFQVGSGEPTLGPSTYFSCRLRTGIGSVESVRGGLAARAGRSSCRIVEGRRQAQLWEEQVVGQSISRSLHGRVAACVGGEQGKSPSIECDGDFDRQCRVVCEAKSPVQPNVNRWCRKLSARSGLRAHRVGEASHPGPRTQNRCEALSHDADAPADIRHEGVEELLLTESDTENVHLPQRRLVLQFSKDDPGPQESVEADRHGDEPQEEEDHLFVFAREGDVFGIQKTRRGESGGDLESESSGDAVDSEVSQRPVQGCPQGQSTRDIERATTERPEVGSCFRCCRGFFCSDHRVEDWSPKAGSENELTYLGKGIW